MAKQMRVGVKAALIGGGCVIIAAIVTALLSKSDNGNISPQTQKVDSGVIYNADGALKIENNTYNNVNPEGTLDKEKKKGDSKSLIIYKEKPPVKIDSQKLQSKNQIINNAPNLGVQINENKGTIIVAKPTQRNFTITEAKDILKEYSINTPIEIWLRGNTPESKRLFDQVANVLRFMGYENVSLHVITHYSTFEPIEKDFQYHFENGKFIFSVFPQQ